MSDCCFVLFCSTAYKISIRTYFRLSKLSNFLSNFIVVRGKCVVQELTTEKFHFFMNKFRNFCVWDKDEDNKRRGRAVT